MRCKDCKQKWELTDEQKAWFQERKLAIPKRCPACRAVRRVTKASLAKPPSEWTAAEWAAAQAGR